MGWFTWARSQRLIAGGWRGSRVTQTGAKFQTDLIRAVVADTIPNRSTAGKPDMIGPQIDVSLLFERNQESHSHTRCRYVEASS
jgi:hypothetical protein